MYSIFATLITLSHLLKRQLGAPLREVLDSLSSDKKRISHRADATADCTGLSQFPQYLTLLLQVDGLFLNDARHLHSIAVLEQSGRYDYCPTFDNGAGLLSNAQTSPMDIQPQAPGRFCHTVPSVTVD